MAKEIAIKIKVEGKEVTLAGNQLDALKNTVKSLKTELEALGTRTEENADAFDKLRGDIDALESAFAQTTTEVNANTESLDTNVTATDSAADATKSYTAQIKSLQVELISLGERTTENADKYDQLTTQIKDLKDKQEDLQFGTMKLDDSLSNLPGPIGKVGQAMQSYGRITGSAKGAMQSLTKTFPILKNAIAATGIGALVIVIGLLVAAVMKAFDSFKPLQTATKELGVALGYVSDIVKPLIEFIGKGLTYAIRGFAAAVAFLTNKTEEFREEQKKLAEEAKDVIELTPADIAEYTAKLDEAKGLVRKYNQDIRKATDERQKAEAEANKKNAEALRDLYKDLLDGNIKSWKEYDEKLLEIIQNGIEEYQKVRDDEAARNKAKQDEANKKAAEAIKDFENRKTNLLNEYAILKLERQKVKGQEELKLQEEIDLKKLEQQKKAQDAEIDAIEGLDKARKKILKDQTQSNYELEKKAIEEGTLRAIEEANADIIKATRELNDSLIADEEDRLMAQALTKYQYAKADIENSIADKKFKDAQIAALDMEFADTITKIEKDALDKRNQNLKKSNEDAIKEEQDKIAIVLQLYENQLASMRNTTDAHYAKQAEIRDLRMAEEVLQVQDMYEKGLLSEEEYQQQKLAIVDKYTREAELAEAARIEMIAQGISTTMAGLSSYLSTLSESIAIQAENDQKALEESYNKGLITYDEYQNKKAAIDKKALDKQKKIKKAQIIMDAAQAVIATWAGYASMSIFGTVLAALQTAFIIASAATAISNVNNSESGQLTGGGDTPGTPSAPPAASTYGKLYAKGGMIEGVPHAQGGTLINAEKGEAVMTKGAVSMFKPLLSMMNQAGGGNAFKDNLFTTFDNPVLVNPNAQSQQLITKTYVVSNELTSEAERQARLKSLSVI